MPFPNDHASRFIQLDRILARHRGLWQIRPFHSRDLCWRNSRPDLCQALERLDEPALATLEDNPEALGDWLQPWLGNDLQALDTLTLLPPMPTRPLAPPLRFDSGIPGRKWRQILAFAAAIPAERRPLLEWCAGKGHLGRLLAAVNACPATSLELDGVLCEAGRAAAARCHADQRFVRADALDPGSARWLPDNGQVVALHACGDLHTSLMALWGASDCARITLSPCCYHLTRHQIYRPLSAAAESSDLKLKRVDLGLPLRETVTGGQGANRRRRTEVLWRLAFDEWQRYQRGADDYLQVPTFPKRLLSGTFTEFCRHAATSKGLAPPDAINEEHWLALGRRRVDLVRRMELVSHRFRRPLEIWLALDRALFLEEQGATVRLGTFCDRSLTPRNILIDGERRH